MNARRFQLSAMALAVTAALGVLGGTAAAQQTPQASTPLPWAYPLGPGGAPPDPTKSHQLPGSSEKFTETQIRNAYNVADWFPNSHPDMPPIVKYGRRPEVRGCAYCHLPNGQGRPENAGIAGLPAEYIVQQIRDWKNGHRMSSEPKMRPPSMMQGIAKAVPFDDARTAAAYFSSLPFKKWIRVVETETVPKTRVNGSMLVKDEAGGTEPIGQRIIEMPEDLERTELRDPSIGFVAYVPVGSIQKGETLVKTGGNGKTVQCTICHGADLKGIGAVPPLAGRSPSYITRQLWDMKQGRRNGPWTQLMKQVVQNLTTEDIVSLAAYTSSRNP